MTVKLFTGTLNKNKKKKKLISCAVTVHLICVFVLAYAKSQFSHNKVQLSVKHHKSRDACTCKLLLQTIFFVFVKLIFCIDLAMCDLVHD